jgi:hypothetical protein
MSQSEGNRPPSSMKMKEVKLNPNVQSALDRLIAKELKRKVRLKWGKRTIVLFLILVAAPFVFSFYCCNIIGTNYEAIIIRQYPLFTEKMVRAAVITDKWYMKALSPILIKIRNKEYVDNRRAVIELGLEMTSAGEIDQEKIRELREVVAVSLNKSPGGVAFAVYELPPKKRSAKGVNH